MSVLTYCCLSRKAFFDKEYITSHPEDTEKITQLKDLMQEQVGNTFNVTLESKLAKVNKV